jgi:peptidoglycan/xylan/chitin deacetylase (PgdA/CDA1 family)
MYHYVRPTDQQQPHLFYLNVDDFVKQLDFFEKNYGFVTREQWQTFTENPNQLPQGVVLTFDDGLIDHYRYVYPILKARGIWGIFYISSSTLKADVLLSVHRVHYLLGRFGGEGVLAALNSVVNESMFIDGFYEQLKAVPYTMQSMDGDSVQVKKIVNYALKPEVKDTVLGRVFEILGLSEAAIAHDFYMKPEHIREMAMAGFSFGAHGSSHNLLTKFSGEELEAEVAGSVQLMNQVLPVISDTFCYPFGGVDSWNSEVLDSLQNQKIRYGFVVQSGDISSYDMANRPLCLPRYDCNEFPFGQARKP